MDVVKDGRKFQRREMAWQGLGMLEERKIKLQVTTLRTM